MTQHWAVIPVKGLTESKKRLSSYLGNEKRLLVESLFRDVLSSALKCGVYDKILVISPDERVAALANASRVAFVRQSSVGLNRGIEQVNRLALKEDVLSLTTILADIPLVEPHDFRELFDLGQFKRKVVMAPSLKGGTNVMMNSPPGLVKPNYGRWSYSKHLRQAQLNRLAFYSISNPRLSLDVDTFEDLIELKRRDPDLRTASAQVLVSIGSLLRAVKLSC